MRSRSCVLVFLFLISLLVVVPTLASTTFTGKVIGVHDGDDITVLRDGYPEKVRLYGIDCPELGQDFGTKAKKTTSELCFGKTVTVKVREYDRYGRTIGIVILPGNINLSEALVSKGMAWWYREYAPDSKRLAELEKNARKAKVGLWSHPNPIPPWEFRRNGTSPQKSSSTNASNAAKGSTVHTATRDRFIYKSATDTGTDIVHITLTGRKYHRAGCRYLSKSDIPISRQEAIARGYEPCKVCRP
jgi:endonuclease YncB( thermonuclease family)